MRGLAISSDKFGLFFPSKKPKIKKGKINSELIDLISFYKVILTLFGSVKKFLYCLENLDYFPNCFFWN